MCMGLFIVVQYHFRGRDTSQELSKSRVGMYAHYFLLVLILSLIMLVAALYETLRDLTDDANIIGRLY
jgi:hypothetical protein